MCVRDTKLIVDHHGAPINIWTAIKNSRRVCVFQLVFVTQSLQRNIDEIRLDHTIRAVVINNTKKNSMELQRIII